MLVLWADAEMLVVLVLWVVEEMLGLGATTLGIPLAVRNEFITSRKTFGSPCAHI